MTLMLGTGPFGQHPRGAFTAAMPPRRGLIYFEESPHRIRARFAGETVVDSRSVKLLHEHGHLPVYYFPREDVRADLLEPTDHHTRCPFKGEASYHSVRVGDRVAENAVWSYPEPIDGAPPIADHLALYWDAMDEWLDEDEPALGHARDPYHRIDVVQSSRHVRVSVDGEVLAETTRPKALFETGLPTRWYFPREDVREDALVESTLTTTCSYKGHANYWSVRAGDGVEEDLLWTYREPDWQVAPIRDHVAFFDERVDVEVDGERQERPRTPWSHRRPAEVT